MYKVNRVLYILNEDTYIHCELDSFIIKTADDEKTRIPTNLISQVVIFGNSTVSGYFIKYCSEHKILVSYVSEFGVYYGGLRGKTVGNILLRQRQYRLYDNSEKRLSTAKNIVLGKAINSSAVLDYTAKDARESEMLKIKSAQEKIDGLIETLKHADSIERIRGLEGTISQIYFGVFDCMIKTEDCSMLFEKRSRRPPENNTNAMLSLLYTLLTLNCIAALETFGLDSYMGYLHELHPGRESLAMDLIEEFRAPLVDRFVLNLINRGQIKKDDFERTPGGVMLCKSSRKKLLELWEKEKEINVLFPLFKKSVPKKMLPYLQAQLMSQFIRGDIEEYPPWSWRP